MEEKQWKDWTEKEISRLKRKVCVNCDYSSSVERGYMPSITCNYILRECKSRGCTPDKCKEKGIFKPRKGRKSQKERRKELRL